MCGIFAKIGQKNDATNLAVAGLKSLEYRGYDSFGFAWKNPAGEIEFLKRTGKISEFAEKLPPAKIAIAHTRWATHGGVTEQNAHPHFDAKNEIAIVHNGIFENYEKLKSDLQNRNFKFETETDTEVAAHLLAEKLDENLPLEKAIFEICKKFVGRFAIVAICKKENKIVAARAGSPLIVGLGDGEFFVASDIPAFLPSTNSVNFLDDGELAILTESSAEFRDLKNFKKIEKRKIKIDLPEEKIEKGDFSHFMLKEIFDQKNSIAAAIDQNDDDLKRVANEIKNARGVFFTGCGTTGKMAMAGEYFFAEVARRHVNFAPSSEFPLFENFLIPETLLVAISQSGETADVLEAIGAAQKAGSQIVALVNNAESTIARAADFTFLFRAGFEKAVAATKTATSQLSLLLLLAFATAGKLEIGKKILIDAAANVNELLNPRFVEFVKKIAQKISQKNDIFIIGKGANFPIALEAAIKIQEVSQIHAEGFAAGELKHGPIALIEKGTPCLVLVGDDKWSGEILSNATELKARGARIVGIAPENSNVFDDFIRVPKSGAASPILNLIPVQLLSFFLAVERGLNPDMPRNLAKSVTVK
jgi:glucosamine--fructose-6-phosphate aminotransferase (isomerizing)